MPALKAGISISALVVLDTFSHCIVLRDFLLLELGGIKNRSKDE